SGECRRERRQGPEADGRKWFVPLRGSVTRRPLGVPRNVVDGRRARFTIAPDVRVDSSCAAASCHGFGCASMDGPLNPTLQRLLSLCRLDRTWVRGEGVWLFDAQGRRFLDCYAQYGAVLLGHNAAPVVAAVRAALEEAEPAMVQPYRAPHAVALA